MGQKKSCEPNQPKGMLQFWLSINLRRKFSYKIGSGFEPRFGCRDENQDDDGGENSAGETIRETQKVFDFFRIATIRFFRFFTAGIVGTIGIVLVSVFFGLSLKELDSPPAKIFVVFFAVLLSPVMDGFE